LTTLAKAVFYEFKDAKSPSVSKGAKLMFDRILYGGDYNPNQWEKAVWSEDMRIFKEANINSATINVFSWAKIQPSENEYYFDEQDEVIEMMFKENYDIVFATTTVACAGGL